MELNDLLKIMLGNPTESSDFHDLIKILVVRKILRKNKKRSWLRIYTEFSINHRTGLKPDIYVEHLRDKSIVCYEIQKEVTEKWVKTTTEKYNKVNIPYFNSIDLVIIPLKKLSHNFEELSKELDEYIV